MLRHFSFILATVALSLSAEAQQPVDIVENTLKIPSLGEEVFYCGFAEGDQLIFNFEEVNGKELKEIEIIELPSSTRFMDYKTTRIDDKKISVPRTGIYKVRFSNSAIGGRICKFKLQRLPGSGTTKSFNTNVYWKDVYDTSYTPEQQRYLISSDTAIVPLADKIVKIHSQANPAGAKSIFDFTLPNNTIAWSYYIGVDQDGERAFEKATMDATKQLSPLASKIPGYGPLAVLALNGVSYFAQLQRGEAINYYVLDAQNASLFDAGQQFYPIKRGKIINEAARMINPLRGTFYFCFYNDNMVTGVNVTVKAQAVTVSQNWGTRTIQRPHVAIRKEAYLSTK